MFDRIKTLLHRLQDLTEVNALSDRDLGDLGMTRDQVRAFAQMPRDVPDRVTAMGHIFGIPEAALQRDHAQWLDLLSACGRCADRGACSKVLAKRSLALPSETGFCPNRETFAALSLPPA